MQVLEQAYLGLLLSARLDHAAHDAEDLPLSRLGIDARGGVRRVGNSHKVEVQRQALAQALIKRQQAAGDALACGGVAVLIGDAEKGAKQPQDRQEGNRSAVRDAAGFVGHQAARPAALEELVAQPALAQSRVADNADNLGIALPRARQC